MRSTNVGTEGGWTNSARDCLGLGLMLAERAVEAAAESHREALGNGDGGDLIPTGKTW
jgi:hypothetical protein